MPRPDIAGSVAHAAEHLIGSITALVQNLRVAAMSAPSGKMSAAPTGALRRATGQRGPGKGNLKLKSALKKSWASYTPEERAERVRKMLAGRGLKPKGAAPRKTKHAAKAKAGAWASMTTAERGERIAKMRAGRTRGS
jgi:hypothetical protein